MTGEELSQYLYNIFRSKALSRAFIYFLEYKAATSWTLQTKLGLSEQSSYWVLKQLQKMNFIIPARKLRKPVTAGGGPRSTVWALVGSHQDDIASASRLHYRSLSPKYPMAESFTQDIIKRYFDTGKMKEFNRAFLVDQLRSQVQPSMVTDIYLISVDCFRERGIKVWS